jgi:RimJ/RimL family protein N-acetyltransferase
MEITLDGQMPKSVPIPLYQTALIGTAENRGESFDIYLGLSEKMAAQIKTFSLDLSDTDLQENTSDYARFGEGSYEEWYSKSRVPFALVHRSTGALAALVWYGPKPLGRKSLKHLSADELKNETTVESGDWHTNVLRSYLPFRGTGIMKGFFKATLDTYMHYFPNAKIWAGVNRNNPASIALHEKLGFKIDESISDDHWVAMIRE